MNLNFEANVWPGKRRNITEHFRRQKVTTSMSEKSRKTNMNDYMPICTLQAVSCPGTMSVSKVSYKYDWVYWVS